MGSSNPQWPVWRYTGDAAGLGRYIVPGIVAKFGNFPAASDDAALSRLRAIWSSLQTLGIGYASAKPLPARNEPGAQAIRPPGEVLKAPGSGTCLDVALVLAGACEHAGLAAAVLVLDPPRAGMAGHAVVAVWLRTPVPGFFAPGMEWRSNPEDFITSTRSVLDGPPRPIVVIDPIGCTKGLGTSATIGQDVSLAQAVVNGHHYIDSGWTLRVAATRCDDPFVPEQLPQVLPLRESYLRADLSDSALRLTRPEFAVTPFQYRAELSVLEDLAEQTTAGDRTAIVVLGGAGGSGKTRLMLELARRLHRVGWYAGGLREAAGAEMTWLAQIRAPLLVFIDYADTRVRQSQALLAAVAAREVPAVVVLVCRTREGGWLPDILEPLRTDAHRHDLFDVDLDALHPFSHNIFRATRARLGDSPAAALPAPDPGTGWTTLDMVLLGWIAARQRDVPDTPALLYDEVLAHELQSWVRAFGAHTLIGADRELLRRAGAYLTMMTPSRDQVQATLRAVTPLHAYPELHRCVAAALLDCLSVEGDDGVGIRPDPVGDHHLLRTLQRYPELLQIPGADDVALSRALLVFTRAAQNDPQAAVDQVRALHREHGENWKPFADVAARRGGPVDTVLREAVADPDQTLPWDELADRIPSRPGVPIELGREIAERRYRELDPADSEQRAEALGGLYQRCYDGADFAGALASAEQAAQIWRTLAGERPELLPELAKAMNNQSNACYRLDDLETARYLNSEALTLYRRLGRDDSDYDIDIAMALNNQAAILSELGDRVGALQACEDAVERYRGLCGDAHDPVALAQSLLNLALLKSESGYIDEPVTLIEESVQLYQELPDPDDYLDERANALNVLGNLASAAGDHRRALAALDEAVTLFDKLVAVNAHYAAEQAEALHNRSDERADHGDLDGGVHDARQAVTIYRNLVAMQGTQHSGELARCLNNLSVRLSQVGARSEALAAASEAMVYYREHDDLDSVDYAIAANNLAIRFAEAGQRREALELMQEVVRRYRRLTAAERGAHEPALASALNNLAIRLSEAGQRSAARPVAEEAVAVRRRLAARTPVFVDSLVRSLITLSNRCADLGDLATAHVTIEEAVARAEDRAAVTGRRADLALALSNRADVRARRGDRLGALTDADQALQVYQDLNSSGGGYRPEFAATVHSRSVRRAETGDYQGACEDAERALALFSELADENTDSRQVDVAMAQHNWSLRLAENGQQEHATVLAESVAATYRRLTRDEPLVFTESLAQALSGCAARYAERGQLARAVATINEAIGGYRELAERDPQVYTTELAQALANRAELGLGSADADLDEAIGLYREAHVSNPGGVAPDLADALIAQAIRLCESDDHDRATLAAEEAVSMYEKATAKDPHAFTAPLARVLSGYTRVMIAAGVGARADARWDSACGKISQPLHRAELRAARARLAHALGLPLSGDHLRWMASDAGHGDRCPGSVLHRIRSETREVLHLVSDADIAYWATGEIPDADLDFARQWSDATPTVRAELVAALPSPTVARTVAALTVLEPDREELAELKAVLERVQQQGVGAVVEELRTAATLDALVDEAIRAQDPAGFLDRHHDTLSAPETIGALVMTGDPPRVRYAGIAGLSRRHGARRAFEIATEVEAATELALRCVDTADLAHLVHILRACPPVAKNEPLGELFTAVVAQPADNRTVEQRAASLAEDSSLWQRQAFAIHLRRLLQAGACAEVTVETNDVRALLNDLADGLTHAYDTRGFLLTAVR
ncbi:tetratricopeptide repeat protein [Nocardia salmonicida]|uniref:tetratricopeptide repeat protein n=1 Tax=Nocardia salmonicida TaxID=53431 RepID=UPI0033DBA997